MFNEETGMGIRHYIIQRRIADSKLLLASRQLKVEAIARQAGYQNTNLFLRQFKSLTKQTPDEYRLALFDDTVSPRPDARIIE
ncbi:MAG: AraC family transcriptional regulator [Kiritimatiellia bacterium]